MGTMQSMHEKNDQIWNFTIWFDQLWPYILRKLPEKCNSTQMFCLSIAKSESHCFRLTEPETWIKNPISCDCTYVSNYACCNQISRSSWFCQQSKIQKRPGCSWTSIQVIMVNLFRILWPYQNQLVHVFWEDSLLRSQKYDEISVYLALYLK